MVHLTGGSAEPLRNPCEIEFEATRAPPTDACVQSHGVVRTLRRAYSDSHWAGFPDLFKVGALRGRHVATA